MKRKLHIGGEVAAAGWEVMNANPAPYVDHVGNANDLSRFPNDTFVQIYASHIVEHLDFKDELLRTLGEWNRVLEPRGSVLISVPDLDILCSLMLQKEKLTVQERFQVMQMIFGGHVDKFDYHLVGLNEELLGNALHQSGFVNIKPVSEFGLFADTSSMKFKGVAISLNMVAEKAGH